MKAGNSELNVNTRIRITRIDDEEDKIYEGLEGRVTHPFPGLMFAPASEYSVGVYVDPQQAISRSISLDRLGQCKVNLLTCDSFVVVETDDDDI